MTFLITRFSCVVPAVRASAGLGGGGEAIRGKKYLFLSVRGNSLLFTWEGHVRFICLAEVEKNNVHPKNGKKEVLSGLIHFVLSIYLVILFSSCVVRNTSRFISSTVTINIFIFT